MCNYGFGALHNQVFFEDLNYGNHFIYWLSPGFNLRRKAFRRNKHISLGNCQKKTWGGGINQIHSFVFSFPMHRVTLLAYKRF